MAVQPDPQAGNGMSAYDQDLQETREWMAKLGVRSMDELIGRLDLIEEPHLGRLMEKIAAPGRPALDRLDFARPATPSVESALNPAISQES